MMPGGGAGWFVAEAPECGAPRKRISAIALFGAIPKGPCSRKRPVSAAAARMAPGRNCARAEPVQQRPGKDAGAQHGNTAGQVEHVERPAAQFSQRGIGQQRLC